MFDVKVTPQQRKYAWDLVSHYNFGNRGIADGNKSEQFIGILGQVVLADLLNLEKPAGSKGFDGGFDFMIKGKKVDVKTMGRTVSVKHFYVHNFIGFQKEFDVDYYLFCSYNKIKKLMTICGLVSKDEFFEKAKLYPRGTKRFRENGTYFETKADLFEIKQRDLKEINSSNDILTHIK